MAHYEVTFTGTKAEKDKQAFREIKSYLGVAGMTRLRRVRNEVIGFGHTSNTQLARAARYWCLFNGVRGYHPERVIRKFFILGAW